MPSTHEQLVDAVAKTCGISMDVAAKRLVLTKPTWESIRDKAGFWQRFNAGLYGTLKPVEQ